MFLDSKPLESPAGLSASTNTPLYYTPVSTGVNVVLAAFTSWDRMVAETASLQAQFAPQAHFDHACAYYPDSLPEQAYFYEHMNGDGDVLSLSPGYAYRDLTRTGRGWFGNWNDVISSVSWCRWDISLYEHVNYGGAQLWLRAGCNYPYLAGFGWNDRASSIVNWGRRF
jgi:hypothetical protein